MWRALKCGGLWALLALTSVAAACGESAKAPPPPATTAGTSNLGVAGTLSVAGSSTTSYTLSNCAGPVPSSTLARWSVVDIDATLDMLFGPGTSLASVIKIGDRGYERDLSYVFVQALRQVALERARSVVAESDVFELCSEDDVAPSCVTAWLRTWGEKLYRRPLTSEQTDAYVAQFRSARRSLSPAAAAQNALVSMLLSPYFVLRIELGDAQTGQLTPDELATRLSRFATRRPPDSELRARAASGELHDPAVRLSELHRLWDTPEGQNARALQILAWLRLDVDRLPGALEPELRAAMLEQTKQLINVVLTNQGGTMLELLGSSHQPISPLLAEHYGLPAPPADGFLNLDASLSAGVLSQSLFLSTYPGPSQRGRALLEGLLCTPVPDHPVQADATLGPGATPRERLSYSTAENPACIGCHSMIDPSGFALEAFDERGRLTGYDTSGSLPVTAGGVQEPVANPHELGRAIATRAQGRMCAARHYLEYVLDRALPNPNSFSANSNSGPPPAPKIPAKPEERWIECLVEDSPPDTFDLNRAAEQLVTSDVFLRLHVLPRRVTAFDTSVAPIEHALQEASQFRGVFSEPLDQSTVELYVAALKQVLAFDELASGAGGEAGVGGEAGAGPGGEVAGGAGGSGGAS